jgi:alkanesulfonate monooxygenase SsuD/methylene tetrahydromethanopterin reductase-like flavin-dependent oxidoreductase (luciferase family)
MWDPDDNGLFEGRHYQLAETLCVPAPVSSPHPEITGGRRRPRARARALEAGIDVKLPGTLCYGEALAKLVRAGTVSEGLVDRAGRRVLRRAVPVPDRVSP